MLPLKGNECHDESVIKVGKWTEIEISQREDGNSYRYTIKVAGVVVKSMVNNNARSFNNVKVYTSDPWFRAAQGSIRNLIINPNTGVLKVLLWKFMTFYG